jgi:hypothetical protein
MIKGLQQKGSRADDITGQQEPGDGPLSTREVQVPTCETAQHEIRPECPFSSREDALSWAEVFSMRKAGISKLASREWIEMGKALDTLDEGVNHLGPFRNCQ